MDWFSWLSKTNLNPSLIHEYSLSFSQNELEEQDIVFLNHDFLKSMGISIAKHRLEILKLAGKNRFFNLRPISALLRRTKRSFSKLFRPQNSAGDRRALVVVPTLAGINMLKRNKKLFFENQGQFLLTNGSPTAARGFGSRVNSFSSPVEKRDGEDEYWGNGVEEIRWDTMFQNLKPT